MESKIEEVKDSKKEILHASEGTIPITLKKYLKILMV
jgi:hypothetical protein